MVDHGPAFDDERIMRLALHRHALRPPAVQIVMPLADANDPDVAYLFTVPNPYVNRVAALALESHGHDGARFAEFGRLREADASIAQVLDFFGWAICPEAERFTARLIDVNAPCGADDLFAEFRREPSAAPGQDRTAALMPIDATVHLHFEGRGGAPRAGTLAPGEGLLLDPAVAHAIRLTPPAARSARCLAVKGIRLGERSHPA